MENYKKLHHQPLKFVIAEFRFSSILQIEKYIPDLQEALRGEYPVFEEKQDQAIQLQPTGIAVSSIKHWSFVSANRKNAFDINRDRLVYVTAEYPRFEGFSDTCQLALDALVAIVKPALIQRIGLRFGNLIKVVEEEDMLELVDPHFSSPGFIESLGTVRHQRTDTFITTECGTLSVRTLTGSHNLTCLPDIQTLPILIEADKEPSERMILDIDHAWEAGEGPVSFEPAELLVRLDSLHKISRQAFWKATSDYAKDEKWA